MLYETYRDSTAKTTLKVKTKDIKFLAYPSLTYSNFLLEQNSTIV